MNQSDMKSCGNCGSLTPIDDLYYYESKNVLLCQACVNGQYDEWQATSTPDKIIKIKESKCSVCKQIKPAKEFYKDKNSRTGLRWCCKECSNRKTTKWRNQNIKHVREYMKNWQTNKRKER